MERTSPIVCITSANSGTYTSAELNWTEKKTNSMPTCSLYEAVSLFVKNFECLSDLVFNLWILEFPEKAILPTKTGIYLVLFLLGHQPDKLVETDVAIPILINDRHHFLDYIWYTLLWHRSYVARNYKKSIVKVSLSHFIAFELRPWVPLPLDPIQKSSSPCPTPLPQCFLLHPYKTTKCPLFIP